MERAPLRPVPRRPEGPVDPAEAIAHVATTLPAAEEPARSVLALVELAGRSRGEVAGERGLSGDEVAEALAGGRKALRRSLYPLPGSGWCERAERMISDRLDGELVPPGPARLDAHLHNCARCVQHELRLAQSIDALVAGFLAAHPAPAAEPEPLPGPAAEPVIRAARPELRVLPFGPAIAPVPAKPLPAEPVPAEPLPAEPVAAAPPQRFTRPARSAALAWNALYALAVVLVVLALVVTALGVAGVDLF